MKNLIAIFILLPIFLLSGCSTLIKQGGLPAISQIDKWVEKNQFGLAISSLERISPKEKMFVAYVNKRKEVLRLAAKYEKQVLNTSQTDIDEENWSAAILNLNTALNNYPTSRLIHKRHSTVLKQHKKRINVLDAKSLLARAKLLYNKWPISKKEVANSPINFSAQWDLQSLENELSDMSTRLLTMAEQLVDDNEVTLAEMCIQQARVLTSDNDKKSLALIQLLQKKINYLNKLKLELAATKAYKVRNRNYLVKKENHKDKVRQLVKKINKAIKNNQLILAEKFLGRLVKLAPNNKNHPKLQLIHRDKVDRLVSRLTAQGNSLYRQEKIAEAKNLWEKALRYDKRNKTLQTQIRRAKRVLTKLKELRKKRSAVRQ